MEKAGLDHPCTAFAATCSWASLVRLLRAFRYVLGCTVACVLIVIVLAAVNAEVTGTYPWGALSKVFFKRCEFDASGGLLYEPGNALSNIGFIYLGFYVVVCGIWDMFYGEYAAVVATAPGAVVEPKASRIFHMGFFPINIIVFGLTCLFQGVGSFLYHASGGTNQAGATMDIMGIMMMMAMLFIFGVITILGLVDAIGDAEAAFMTPRTVEVVGILSFIVLTTIFSNYDAWIVQQVGWWGARLVMIGFFVLLITCVLVAIYLARTKQVTPNFSGPLFSVGIGCLIIGVLAWYPEEINSACPSSLVLHAIWHFFVALAVLFNFLFARTLGSVQCKSTGLFDYALLRIRDDEQTEGKREGKGEREREGEMEKDEKEQQDLELTSL